MTLFILSSRETHSFVLMAHARSTHQPWSASNKTNNPPLISGRPRRTEYRKERIAANSKIAAADARTTRPLNPRFAVKSLFMSFKLLAERVPVTFFVGTRRFSPDHAAQKNDPTGYRREKSVLMKKNAAKMHTIGRRSSRI